MKYLLLISVLIIVGCSSKNIEINGLVCPDTHTEQMVQTDLNLCRYYDEKAIAESSKSPLSPDCRECLEKKGYKIKK